MPPQNLFRSFASFQALLNVSDFRSVFIRTYIGKEHSKPCSDTLKGIYVYRKNNKK